MASCTNGAACTSPAGDWPAANVSDAGIDQGVQYLTLRLAEPSHHRDSQVREEDLLGCGLTADLDAPDLDSSEIAGAEEILREKSDPIPRFGRVTMVVGDVLRGALDHAGHPDVHRLLHHARGQWDHL